MSSDDPSQLPVARSFSNQGTVDLTRLAELSLTFPFMVLARCSAAGVDPYTVIVGQTIAQRLPLGATGDQNVQRALSDLRVYSGFGFRLENHPPLAPSCKLLAHQGYGRLVYRGGYASHVRLLPSHLNRRTNESLLSVVSSLQQ